MIYNKLEIDYSEENILDVLYEHSRQKLKLTYITKFLNAEKYLRNNLNTIKYQNENIPRSFVFDEEEMEFKNSIDEGLSNKDRKNKFGS